LKIEVAAGSHEVQAASPEAWSRTVAVEVEPGHTLKLRVSSWPGAAWFNPLLLGRTIHLRLRIENVA
jgi:hypothetical protein